MSDDPIIQLAKLRVVRASADLEVQLASRSGSAPTIEILSRLRDRAAESLAALAVVDPFDRKAIMALQNEVKRYDEWVGWIREVIDEGKAIDREMTQDARTEMLDVLLGTPQGQRTAVELGLIDEIAPHDA